MRNIRLAILLPLLLLAACGGCVGTKARSATFGAFENAWSMIKVQVEREALAAENDMAKVYVISADRAVNDPTLQNMVSVAWGEIDALALSDTSRRLSNKEIGEILAKMQRRQIDLFKQYRTVYIKGLK